MSSQIRDRVSASPPPPPPPPRDCRAGSVCRHPLRTQVRSRPESASAPFGPPPRCGPRGGSPREDPGGGSALLGPGRRPPPPPGRLLLACRAAHRPVLVPGVGGWRTRRPRARPGGSRSRGRATAIRPRRHPASARDCDSAVAQVRPPPPAAPPPPLPHGQGRPGSTRGSGVGPAGDPGLGPAVPERTLGARGGGGARSALRHGGRRGTGSPASRAGGRCASFQEPRPHVGGLRLSGWGPAPPPTAAVRTRGLP